MIMHDSFSDPNLPLNVFRESLADMAGTSSPAARLQAETIGEGDEIETPFGRRTLVYADYVASGRALWPVEDFVLRRVLPVYANTHTEASHCGAAMSRMRAHARRIIARHLQAGPECAVIFAGSGATAGVNRLVSLFGIREAAARGEKVAVLVGPYEHHSNLLPWRESGAEVVRVPEAPQGGPDPHAIEAELDRLRDADLVVGAFSAVSNVTGIVTDVVDISRRLKRAGALVVWDWAAGAPYLDMTMQPAPDAPVDAIVYSSHKFPGGPGASGILAVRRSAVLADVPTAPGGGTVRFVSPWRHDYLDEIEAREEGGTPNVVGDIRAALVILVKEALGSALIERRNRELNRRARGAWRGCPHIELLGREVSEALPIFSFRIRDGQDGWIHHQLFTRMLSDVYGIQARGGCACAGPYAHDLLDLDCDASERLERSIAEGHESEKPGWIRLNLSYLMDDTKADHVIEGVIRLAAEADEYTTLYRLDPATARFAVACKPPDAQGLSMIADR